MINIVITEDYKLKPNEIEIDVLDIQTIRCDLFDEGKTLVYDADINGLTKSVLDDVIDNAKRDIKIISSDYNIVKGKRTSKSLKIDRGDIQKEGNPFAISTAIFETENRNDLLAYLKENRVHLFMPVKIMISEYRRLTPRNQKILEKLDQWLFKVNNEMLYALMCFGFEAQPFQYPKYRFPKKEDKDEKAKG